MLILQKSNFSKSLDQKQVIESIAAHSFAPQSDGCSFEVKGLVKFDVML